MIGKSLHHYRVVERIGAGGMGEVYRATDTRLGRDVAIKTLPEGFARDPERLARFEREARVLAALSHPNIATIHGLEVFEGVRFLVMEYVPGLALQGPLPIEEALGFCLQVSGALEAAHEKGIIHRDLKPANVKVTPDGKVKVLDFGLAKSVEAPVVDSSQTPTITAATHGGAILGTAAYMSPEQARGRPLDRRTDIWSFGCVLFEALAGRRAFAGDTASDTIASILRTEPDWDALPAHTPARPRTLLRRCLQKDPMRRMRDIGDVRLEIEESLADLAKPAAGAVPTSAPTVRRSTFALALIALLILLGGAAAGWWLAARQHFGEATRTVEVRRLTEFEGLERFPALSPDGRAVAFTADAGGKHQIWVRLLGGGAPLQLTRDAADHFHPRWSPDSTTIIYLVHAAEAGAPGVLWEVSALGGSPRRIAEAISGGDISRDGRRIAFFRGDSSGIALTVTSRDGSNPQVVARLPATQSYSIPRWSPDDQRIAYQSGLIFNFDVYAVAVSGGEPQRITNDGAQVSGFTWLPDGSGIVYSSARDSTMLYLPTMNLWRQNLDGGPAQQLTFGESPYMQPDTDSRGQVVVSRQQRRFDIWRFPIVNSPSENVRAGVPITRQTGQVQTPSPSPDDREIVYLSDSGGHGNLWITGADGSAPRQLTFEQDPNTGVGVPVWSPDGKYIAYVMRKPGLWNVDQWIIQPNGSNHRKVGVFGGWAAWAPDSTLYFVEQAEGKNTIYKMRPDAEKATLVRDDQTFSPAPAADGTLYFTASLAAVNGAMDFEIRKARPEGGSATVVVRIPRARIPPWQLLQPVLSPDGKWLALPLTHGTTTNVWAISTVDGSLRQLTDFGTRSTFIARRVSWSADGKSIYAALGESASDIVLLDGLITPR
ncbi:MAG: protein kinase domain-containing protein [Candidatus Acidiferrales bacterium]